MPTPGNTLIALSPATSCGLSGLREAVLAQVNTARAAARSCGGQAMAAARPLAWNDVLFSTAARHSVDMASRNYFSHTSPEGVDMGQRASAEGYAWSSLGENIAAGNSTVSGVMALWLASPGHCSNIMNPAFTEVAVACVARPGTVWGTYWTMALGRR